MRIILNLRQAILCTASLEITAPVAVVALPRKTEIKSSVPFTKQIAA